VGEEAEAAGPAKELVLVVTQVPDAVPRVPPPSKTEFEPDVPALDVPVPEDVPVIELSVTDVVPVVEVVVPKDACGIEPPMPEHSVLAVSPIGDVPDVVGLTPGDASSVAPRGMPVGATAAPGPRPSGDVMPSGGPGEICAKAEPHPKRTAAVVVIAKRVIVFDPIWAGARRAPNQLDKCNSRARTQLCEDCGDRPDVASIEAARISVTERNAINRLRDPSRTTINESPKDLPYPFVAQLTSSTIILW
jgi:hypothetical protein